MNHLFSLENLSQTEVNSFFNKAQFFKENFYKHKSFYAESSSRFQDKIVALVFFEPSTRTRFSFEMASARIGAKSTCFTGDQNTSLAKGETLLDTLKNLEAMSPDVFVIRSGDESDILEFYKTSKTPIINAGFGKSHHPSQALLDMFTLKEQFKNLEGKKLLFLGDVENSRVAHSNLQLAELFHMKVGVCSPDEFLPKSQVWKHAEVFRSLGDALQWCDVVMALRTQKERIQNKALDFKALMKPYQLNSESIKPLKSSAFLMHPGPFVLGEEVTLEATQDKRSLIYKQVENGVYIRAAILDFILGAKP